MRVEKCCATRAFNGLAAQDGRTLPLRATRLQVRAAGGIAQVRLVQTFTNPWTEPLHVTYRLPLPADAAVGGFVFRLGDQVVTGEIDRRAAARERFERAIASGHTAALLEQERSAVFTQELGNLPPGAELEASIEIDQPLLWVDDGWQWRFPTTVAPRYLGGPGRIVHPERQQVDVHDPGAAALPARCEIDLVVADALPGNARPRSSSHALSLTAGADGMRVVFDAPEGRVAMDREVVVHWPVAAPQVGVQLRIGRGHRAATAAQAFGLLTIVPPAAVAGTRCLPRDLIVLLDISGSMAGAPLAQARQVTTELVRSLGADDQLELIAFASRPLAWREGALAATPANQAAAVKWLVGLQAGGSTEMGDAILRALAALRGEAQRQVVLITDGQIGFESEVVGAIRRSLPAWSRVHVVGVGSAPNRTLTRGASRAGHGCEVLLGVDEPVGPAVARLLARTAAPLVDGLAITGSALVAMAPQALPDLFAGAPARIAVQLRPEGGALQVRGRGSKGGFVHELVVPPVASGNVDAVLARGFARETAEDLELELAATGDARAVDPQLEQLGLTHGIATRLTSWIAVSDAPTVDPRTLARREVVPQELAYGMSVAQLGLRSCWPAMSVARSCAAADESTLLCADLPPPASPGKVAESGRVYRPRVESPRGGLFDRLRRVFQSKRAVGLRAVLRLRTPTGWVFELHGIESWSLPMTTVVVLFADGSEVELALDAARTTAAGTVAAGTVVRLALLPRGGTTAAAPAQLRLVLGSGTLDIPVA
ncbi:MAG: VIT domain-containing protein [Planctomycetota bacterium]